MRQYLSAIIYLMIHKWYVMLNCFEFGLYWRGITHDLSKLHPLEIKIYAKNFYNKDGSKKDLRDENGHYDPLDHPHFVKAWKHHYGRNSHHWQHHVVPKMKEGVLITEMPREDVLEMIADVKGANKSQGYPPEQIKKWWDSTGPLMQLHDKTREVLNMYFKHNTLIV